MQLHNWISANSRVTISYFFKYDSLELQFRSYNIFKLYLSTKRNPWLCFCYPTLLQKNNICMSTANYLQVPSPSTKIYRSAEANLQSVCPQYCGSVFTIAYGHLPLLFRDPATVHLAANLVDPISYTLLWKPIASHY
jgi:hypothetical protein